jgi:hypothetical protein
MSTARLTNFDLLAPPVAQTAQQRTLVVGVVFGILSAVFAFLEPDQFFHSYLLGYMLWLGLTLGCLALLMLQHVTGGVWGTVIRRPLEAGTRTLPLMLLLFIPVVLGMHHLYGWLDPAVIAKDKRLHDVTQAYLTYKGFIIRAVIYFLIWGWLIYSLNRASAAQDQAPTRDLPVLRRISAPGLLLYAFSLSFAVIDWVMSLNAPWISTIYALIFIVGQSLSAMSLMVVVEAIFYKYKPTSVFLKPREVHDHGKLMLAFTMLWAYFSFSQLLITWAGNLPDEITWFTRRLNGGWQGVGLYLFLFHFAVPFLLLLSRPFKRNPRTLIGLAAWMIFMRLVDLYWYVEPTWHPAFHLSFLDIAVPLGIGGFWLALFFSNLRSRPLLVLHDPKSQALLEPAHD